MDVCPIEGSQPRKGVRPGAERRLSSLAIKGREDPIYSFVFGICGLMCHCGMFSMVGIGRHATAGTFRHVE